MSSRSIAARPAPSRRSGRRKWLVAGVAAAVCASGLTGLAGATAAGAASSGLVVSEVYGGGGNGGASFRNDYVELQNRGSVAVDVTGWSVQYASAAGTTFAATPLTGTVEPGAFYLVQLAGGAATFPALPAPDATGTTNMSATSGKVALVGATAPLAGCSVAVSCAAAPGVVDFVGYGTPNDWEGPAAAEPGGNALGVYRLDGADTDDNLADFSAAVPTPRAATAVAAAPGTDCSAPDTTAGAVQGSGPATPVPGTTVTVQGTVVGDYEGPAPALRGFYLQDAGDGDPTTSDAVFVFNNLEGLSPDSVRPGQTVQVTGTAGEFQDQTQVSASRIDVCADAPAPAPVDVTLPATPEQLEPFEGMLVRLPQTMTVTELFQLGRFGEVLVSSGGKLVQPTARFRPGPEAAALQAENLADQIFLDDGSNVQNPATIVFGRGGAPLSATNPLRGGDTVTGAVGVLTYGFGGDATASPNAFRVRPVGALGGTATFEATNPRPAGTPDVGGTLRVGSANLLNFFNTFTGCTLGVGGPTTGCRGAENQLEYDRQLPKQVLAITSLGVDVLGVNELENDGYGPSSSVAVLVDALNAAEGAGTWAFVDADAGTGVTNSAGTDAIRTALLYKPAAVTPVAGATFTDRAKDAAGLDVFERHPVAQTFLVRRNGARVTVVANHFKSKGSCPTDLTSPDADRGDGQSCWNARRTAQATELARWLAADVAPAAGTTDVLVVGDLNSYAGEDPVFALESAGYVNLPKRFGGEEAYSYVFDGQWGYLDHVLASASLAPRATGAADVHINSDEASVLDYNTNFKSVFQVGAGPASLYAPDRFRTSDHDPVVTGLQTVGATTTAVTSSAPAATYRGAVSWTATVSPVAGEATPTGTVQFTLGGKAFGAPVPLVGGVATSASTRDLPPGATTVGALYSGDADYSGSTTTFAQEVRFAVSVTRPADGATARAGSTVQVRVQLRDANGRTVPDALARQWVATCSVKVEVIGVQTLAPRCVREYDRSDRELELSWKTARSPKGAVTVTVLVTYPGITAAQTVSRSVTLT
ncbi:ExeM/NucH family extracellular endonuclease [Kineosporia sp. R_H_3]|uniref:ExeM/NucH family extracellular endonuclease n=1 Tax=Kineosporia sp. R_H_3 TaxID=1961848 RepID=UPI0018E957D2|nr:ExeM/NucH family extracellular endonuclease [Kineosporia sp. R_H_3]